jgi:hypothetical protein
MDFCIKLYPIDYTPEPNHNNIPDRVRSQMRFIDFRRTNNTYYKYYVNALPVMVVLYYTLLCSISHKYNRS